MHDWFTNTNVQSSLVNFGIEIFLLTLKVTRVVSKLQDVSIVFISYILYLAFRPKYQQEVYLHLQAVKGKLRLILRCTYITRNIL